MYKATVTAGVGFDMHGDILQANALLPKIRREIARHAGGYTELNTKGGWVDDEGELVDELGKQWIVYLPTSDRQQAIQQATMLAEFVRDSLNQRSVMLEFGEAVVHIIESESPILVNEVEYHE